MSAPLRIAVVGNCHATTIGTAVRAALKTEPGLDCRVVFSWKLATPEERAFIEAADRVLLQVSNLRAGSAEVAGRSDVGRFPLVSGSILYPFAGRAHPRTASTRSEHCPSGYYEGQLSDSALLDVMEKHGGEPPERIADRYLALDYASMLDLDRLFEMARLTAGRLGEITGFNPWPRIERTFRDAPVFWTYLHPNGSLLRELVRHALGQLNLGLRGEAVEEALAAVREPFGFAHMPIHPSVARHFGIEWARDDYRYLLLPDGAFTAREFALRFIRFDHEDELARAIHELHSGKDVPGAMTVLSRARARMRDNGHLLMNLAVGHWKLGQIRPAMEAAVSAVEREPDRREWAEFLCLVVRHSGLAAP